MNRKKIYISIIVFVCLLMFVVVIFIANKANKKKYNSNILFDNEEANVFANYDFSNDSNGTSFICLTESSDYFFLFIEYERNIYKIYKKTGVAEIMCNNPQCTHKDSTCGAHMTYPESGIWFHYYNGRLYYTTVYETNDDLLKEEWLVSMDLDGKDRKKEVKINEIIVNSGSGCGISMDMYGKEIYLSKTYNEVDEDKVSRSIRTEINRIDLDTSEVTKIYEKSQKGIHSGVTSKKDNIVYFYTVCNNQDGNLQYISLLTYDENTGNITEKEIGNNVFLGISGDNEYYNTAYENEGKILVKKSDSQEYEEVLNLGKDGTECAIDIYNNYIIVNNWAVRNKEKEDTCITIYDTEGNFVKKISTYGYTSDTKIANGFLFTEKQNENNQYDIYVCSIATDTNTWTKIN